MGILTRKQNWPQLLREAIEEKKHSRFQPGTHDCCISACDIVEKMTGVDVAAEFRGYTDKEGMQATLAEHGGVEMIAESVMIEYGCSEIPPSMAQRGDFLLLDMPDGATIANVDLDGVRAVACSDRGWQRLPIKGCAKRAWRVG